MRMLYVMISVVSLGLCWFLFIDTWHQTLFVNFARKHQNDYKYDYHQCTILNIIIVCLRTLI